MSFLITTADLHLNPLMKPDPPASAPTHPPLLQQQTRRRLGHTPSTALFTNELSDTLRSVYQRGGTSSENAGKQQSVHSQVKTEGKSGVKLGGKNTKQAKRKQLNQRYIVFFKNM